MAGVVAVENLRPELSLLCMCSIFKGHCTQSVPVLRSCGAREMSAGTYDYLDPDPGDHLSKPDVIPILHLPNPTEQINTLLIYVLNS